MGRPAQSPAVVGTPNPRPPRPPHTRHPRHPQGRHRTNLGRTHRTSTQRRPTTGEPTMPTTVKPLTGKDAIWREFSTFMELNELVADSARILPHRIIRDGEVPEGYFIFVECGGDEIEAAMIVRSWARAMGSELQTIPSPAVPIPGLPKRRWYTTQADVAGIRIHVVSDHYEIEPS